MTMPRRTLAAALAVASLALLAPVASAQLVKRDSKVDAPTPGKEDADRPFLTHWILMICIIALIVGVNCIPSKRGHQD